MTVSIDDVKKLREKTQAGVVDCQKALKEANGDFGKAEKLLLEKGIASAEKRGSRETKQGRVESYIHSDGKTGVMVEVQCETDFVARTDEFKNLCHELSMQVAAMDPADVKALFAQPWVKDDKRTIEELVKEVIAKTGENVVVKRFIRYRLGE